MRAAARTAGTAAGMVLSVVCLGATPAAAHTDLVDSSPQAGAQVTEAPGSLTLTFDEPIDARFAAVTVTGGDGSTWASGTPEVVGDTVAQSLRPLPGGTYTASYRVVAADGHPISGTLTFGVTATAATTAGAEAPPAAPGAVLRVAPAAAVSTEADGGASLLPLAGGGGVVLLLAAGAVAARRRATASVPSHDGSR